MSSIFVMEQGSQIGISENRVEVRNKNNVISSTPIETVENMYIFGHSGMTDYCIKECLSRNIPVSFHSSNGVYFGKLVGHEKTNAQRLRKQVLIYDSEKALALTKKVLVAKLENQRTVLGRYARTTGIDVKRSRKLILYFEKKIQNSCSIEQARGFEGIAARIYFLELSHLVDSPFAFKGRSTQPPLDAFNAMLSLGYSMLTKEIYGYIESCGLNPYLGFMHRDRQGHATLASDLIEEWRPVIIDSIVMSLVNGHEVDISEFNNVEGGGVFLSKGALKTFMKKYESKMQSEMKYSNDGIRRSYRSAVASQARKYAQMIETGDSELYEPIKMR